MGSLFQIKLHAIALGLYIWDDGKGIFELFVSAVRNHKALHSFVVGSQVPLHPSHVPQDLPHGLVAGFIALEFDDQPTGPSWCFLRRSMRPISVV